VTQEVSSLAICYQSFVVPLTMRRSRRSLDYGNPLQDGRFRPKKRFGQNFLQDRGIAAKIVDAAALDPGDAVVELGPGHGVLTRLIAATGARVVALELDRGLVAELGAEFDHRAGAAGSGRGRVDVVAADFTRVTLGELLGERGIERCVLIGNIPYHLTRNVLFDFLVEEAGRIARAVVMMQREVGERIVSPPGSRVYGITSVVLQSLYDIRVVTKVAPGSFHPRPRVASIVLGFHPLRAPFLQACEVPGFVKLVKSLFQQRRKTVYNTLRAFYPLPEETLARVAAQAGVDPKSRPEALSREQFRALARALDAAGA
jgi:16S rRNA (adenine1518-N6/adenine1519-N6)-dimethyltransferase